MKIIRASWSCKCKGLTLRPRGSATGGDGGDASPPILRGRGIIPPIFRKIVGQIRWVFGFWYGLSSEENPGFAAAWSPSPPFSSAWRSPCYGLAIHIRWYGQGCSESQMRHTRHGDNAAKWFSLIQSCATISSPNVPRCTLPWEQAWEVETVDLAVDRLRLVEATVNSYIFQVEVPWAAYVSMYCSFFLLSWCYGHRHQFKLDTTVVMLYFFVGRLKPHRAWQLRALNQQ